MCNEINLAGYQRLNTLSPFIYSPTLDTPQKKGFWEGENAFCQMDCVRLKLSLYPKNREGLFFIEKIRIWVRGLENCWQNALDNFIISPPLIQLKRKRPTYRQNWYSKHILLQKKMLWVWGLEKSHVYAWFLICLLGKNWWWDWEEKDLLSLHAHETVCGWKGDKWVECRDLIEKIVKFRQLSLHKMYTLS